MAKPTGRESEGQSLVLVAVLMVVLLMFVALAVDVGQVYQRRRQMQNAADAGALAGAREICFGDASQAEAVAETYALTNEADAADVSLPEYWRVVVTATEVMPAIFLNVIGMETVDVGAVAEATCSNVSSLCDLFPLTFNEERWDELDGCLQDTPVPDVFYVFNDDSLEDESCWFSSDTPPDCPKVCDVCNCTLVPPDNNSFIIGPGHRGWVNFPRPERPYPDDENCTNNCGAQQIKCWIGLGGYTGSIDLTPVDEGIMCLPGEPGVSESVRITIDQMLQHGDLFANVLIWDRECTEEEPVSGTCPGTPYHIVKTGCVEILEVLEVDLDPMPGYTASDCAKLKNTKVIKALKLCECDSECGSTDGGPPIPGEVNAVSLIR